MSACVSMSVRLHACMCARGAVSAGDGRGQHRTAWCVVYVRSKLPFTKYACPTHVLTLSLLAFFWKLKHMSWVGLGWVVGWALCDGCCAVLCRALLRCVVFCAHGRAAVLNVRCVVLRKGWRLGSIGTGHAHRMRLLGLSLDLKLRPPRQPVRTPKTDDFRVPPLFSLTSRLSPVLVWFSPLLSRTARWHDLWALPAADVPSPSTSTP